MSDTDQTVPDRVPGAPHPRETAQLYGQAAAEAGFLEAFNTGRLHHGWLLTGPRGVGKASLAWKIARFLLATPDADEGGLFGDALPAPDSLAVADDHSVARRIMAGAEPGLHLVRRGGQGSTDSDRQKNWEAGKFSKDIRVDEIRKLASFVNLSAADGGRRVVIIDAADEMNVAAANALLKMLEEPPARTTMLLVAHQPARLLPTIRSRCRELRLERLSAEDVVAALAQAGVDPGENAAGLAELSGGSAGEAVRLSNLDGLAIYAELVGLLGSLPQLDRPRALKLAEAAAQRGAEEKQALLFTLLDMFLARVARAGATGVSPQEAVPGEHGVITKLAGGPAQARIWADCAQDVGARARHGRAVNLDPAALVLDTVFKLQKTATSL